MAGVKNSSYSGSLSASGGHSSSYTYSISSGSLPTGLTLNPTSGAITGKPLVSGTFSFTAKAADSDGHSTTASGSIKIQ